MSTNISCPECGAVLRPAKPLPAGKSVKCPKCGAGFAIGARNSRSADARVSPARPAPSPVKKKPSAGPAPAPVAPIAPVMPGDDEEGGGIYSVATGKEHDGGIEIDYAPDVGIRDLRGPAVMEIVNPTNKMILVAATGFLGWVAFLVIMIIPILFPNKTSEDIRREKEDKDFFEKTGMHLPKPKDDDSSMLVVGDLDLRKVANLPWYLIVPCLLPMPLGMIYSATLAAGAVKTQSLESREWGIASAVMAMVPLNAGGLLCILTMVLGGLLDLLGFEGAFKWIMLGLLLTMAWGTNLACGIWLLTVLNKPEVIAGFEYVPE